MDTGKSIQDVLINGLLKEFYDVMHEHRLEERKIVFRKELGVLVIINYQFIQSISKCSIHVF